jgi:AcrR family transcriptional regulator
MLRAMESRRDRRKRQTRTTIAECAWHLFAARGFDPVTVAEIAEAADVAVGTVFNYFPSKEAILFDRADAFVESLVTAIRDRPLGQGVVTAFRGWHDGVLAFLTDPAADERTRRLLELVAETPSLQAHERTLDDRYRQELTSTLADRTRTDPTPALLAGQLVALHRSIAELARTLILAGTPPRTLHTRVATATRRGFALLSEEAHAWG